MVIVPLDRLLKYEENRYVLTRAAMVAVDKIGNMKDYPDENTSWKVVPNILRMILGDDLNFEYTPPEKEIE
ncbi:MAG: hypothetical protein GY754_20060 [bacterium]|nr:hypothetical protein [bacterium]